MCGAIGVTVSMAVKAGHPAAGFVRAAILGFVKLLLGEGRQQQAQSFQFLRVHDPVEQFVVIHDRHEFALGDVTQVRT